jgi:hypothetical protein
MKALKLFAAALLVALPLLGAAQDKPAEAKPTITPYGFVLLNAFMNQGTFVAKDYPGQVAATDVGDAFLMSARQSRFGIRLALKDDNWTGAELSGVIEFDFNAGQLAGANAASTNWYNGLMRLRLAAATAAWKFGDNSFSVLAGQEYGLVNPLFAESLNYLATPLFWQAGNLWRRSPQIRLAYNAKFGNMGLLLQGAVLSPADGFTDDTGPHGIDYGAGNASGVPDLEARAAFNAKFGDVGGTVGVAYHTEQRTYNVGSATVEDEETTSLIGVDVDLAITKYLQVKGEFYTGSGADDTYAGPMPSYTGSATAVGDLVDTTGFWVQAIVKPTPMFTLIGGYGSASGDEDVITSATARETNTQLAFGAIVNAGKYWRFGVEYVMTTTTYGDANEVDASQIALGSQFRF